MKNSLLDLRFVIGSFFCVIGLLLLGYGWIGANRGTVVNIWCGLGFVIFGAIMILLSFRVDESDEVLE